MKSMPVDMVATARATQWSAASALGDDYLKAVAPAKVNLVLAVGESRPDGYHEVVNIMHTLALHDVLYAGIGKEPRDAGTDGENDPRHCAAGGIRGNLSVVIDICDMTGAPSGGLQVAACDNLVFKAIDALAKEIGRTDCEQIRIRLEKHIPHQAGLGGGSADAACALVAACRFWGLSEDDGAVLNVARRLGADVAFFLRGGAALYTGIGEKFGRALVPMKDSLVIIKPEAGIATEAAYAAFDKMPPAPIPESVGATQTQRRADEVPFFNNLAKAAESLCPELAEARLWLLGQKGVATDASGGKKVLLCGSGTATFAVCDNFSSACAIATEAHKRGWWARSSSFSSLRAAIRPKEQA